MTKIYFSYKKSIIIFSVSVLLWVSIQTSWAQRRLLIFPMTNTVSFSPDTFEVRTRITFKNISETKHSYVWDRNITDLTNGWVSFVCDANNCWSSNASKSPKTLDLPPGGAGSLEVVMRPNHQAGQAQLELKMHEYGSNKNVQIVKLNFEAKKAVKEDNLNFKIFPNPATDYFQLEGEGIDKVMIYNIIGREVRSYKVTEGGKYAVNDLPEGIYIIRLINSNGLPVKTIRLSKSRIKA